MSYLIHSQVLHGVLNDDVGFVVLLQMLEELQLLVAVELAT